MSAGTALLVVKGPSEPVQEKSHWREIQSPSNWTMGKAFPILQLNKCGPYDLRNGNMVTEVASLDHRTDHLHGSGANSPSFLVPFFLLFFAFSLGFSPRVSIMDLTGFLAFSESSNFFMVAGTRILLLSSASLKNKRHGWYLCPVQSSVEVQRTLPPRARTEPGGKQAVSLNTQFSILEAPSRGELIEAGQSN